MASSPFQIVRLLQNLSGWQRAAAAFFFGFLAAFAFPPFSAIPVIWLSFPVLFILLQGTKNLKSAFAVGWSFAFGLLTLSLYWIAGSLFVDIKSFWWALPFAVLGLPAFFAVYYGLATAFAHAWGLDKIHGVFFLALSWFLADMGRGHLFTGFPWDITGYVWGDVLPVLQITHFIGIEGLSLLTLCLALLPAIFILSQRRIVGWLWLVGGVVVFVLIGVMGQVRLASAPSEMVPDVRLRIVQPHVDQSLKWKPEQRLRNFQNLLMLSFEKAGEKPVTHYVWPETATAYYLAEEENVRARITENMPENAILLTGTVRRQAAEDRYIYYNSLIAMDSKAKVIAGYDKHHLVPFGEYMPFRSLIPFPVISALGTDFMAGEAVRTTRAPRLPPFSPLICYEVIFSGDVVEREDAPQFLLNLTNDAWYDGTIGPAQHFAIARVRAVEEGLPLVRAANRGVTGVIDSYGRIVASVGANEPAFIDSDLPVAAKNSTRILSSFSTVSWVFTGILSLLLVCWRILSRKRGSYTL